MSKQKQYEFLEKHSFIKLKFTAFAAYPLNNIFPCFITAVT